MILNIQHNLVVAVDSSYHIVDNPHQVVVLLIYNVNILMYFIVVLHHKVKMEYKVEVVVQVVVFH